jgi:copper chaperone CopZ
MPPMPPMPPMDMKCMSMAMYFNAKTSGVNMLFEDWCPTTPLSFTLSCLAVVALGIAEEAVRRATPVVNARLVERGGSVLRRNAVRALFTFFQSTLSYGLMLLAMTFDVYIFFSVIIGFALGTLLFSHWSEPKNDSLGKTVMLRIDGMASAECARRIEAEVRGLSGVESASVDIASGTALVVCFGGCSAADVVAAVKTAGYTAAVQGVTSSSTRLLEQPLLVQSDCCR